jgi:hypothetical protein
MLALAERFGLDECHWLFLRVELSFLLGRGSPDEAHVPRSWVLAELSKVFKEMMYP